MPIRPVIVTFFFRVYLFYEYVQSNQSNTHDRKKKQSKLISSMLFSCFSARLFLVYKIKSLGSDYASETVIVTAFIWAMEKFNFRIKAGLFVGSMVAVTVTK